MSRAWIAAAMAIIVSVAACGGSAPEHIVARVGNTPVSAAELAHWTSMTASEHPGTDDPQQASRQQALGFLIGAQWLIGEAAEEGMPVAGQEVHERLRARIESYANGEAEFREVLKLKGETVADVMFEIESELASSKIDLMLRRREPQIAEARSVGYYDEHRPSFVLPEERQVVVWSTESESEARRLEREVERGRNLADVNERKLLVYVRHPPRNALETAIYSAPRDVVTGPVAVGPNRFVFEVRHIVPARLRTFAQVRRLIEARLVAEQRRRNLLAFVKAWEKKWGARTSCAPGFIIRKCRQYTVKVSTPEVPASLE